MALLADRVKETTTTTGTGTVSLAGAPAGFQSFNTAFANGSLVYYVIQGGAEWEIGIGTTGTGTLARTTVLQSSNADALVPFSAGVKDVFCSYVADRAVTTVDAATLTNKTIDDYTNNVGANSTHFRIKATGTISKGSVVKATGYNPGENAIEVAVVTSATDLVLGISEQALTAGQFGLAVVIGELFDVNTNGFTVGNIIYSNGAGGFTETKPASGLYQALGWIVRANTNNGVIAVNVVAPLYVETATNTANTSVLRDGSGNFAAGTITATLSGTATQVSNALTAGTYLTSGGTYNGSAARTFAVDATDANTASKVVARDASGNFSAGTITATLNGAAPAGSLSGNTLASGVTASSLTSVGTLSSLTVSGDLIVDTSTLKVDSTGNRVLMGIASAIQGDSLEIAAKTDAGAISLFGRVADNMASIAFRANGATTQKAAIRGSDSGLDFLTGSTVRATFDTSGNLAVDTNTLFVDAANNRVGIGTASPGQALEVSGADGVRARVIATAGGTPGLILSSAGATAYTIKAGNGDSSLRIDQDGTDRIVLSSGGNLAVDTNTLYVDAANNRVGVGTASPSTAVDVYANANAQNVVLCRNADTNTANYDTQVYYRLDVAGNHIGGLKSTAKNLVGLSTPALFLTTAGAYPIAFGINSSATPSMVLDTSGNLGLGVTPSAWGAGSQAIQNGGGAIFQYNNDRIFIGQNNYIDTAFGDRYIGTGYATRYRQYNGAHAWFTAPSGANAGDPITFGDPKMTLDASGRLGVGTTSPTSVLHVVSSTNSAWGAQVYNNGSTDAHGLYVYTGASSTGIPFRVDAKGTEAARITNGGYFKASNDGTYVSSTSSHHELRASTASNEIVQISHTNSTDPFGQRIKYTAASPNGTGNWFLYCDDSTALRAEIRSNGGIANYSANNVALSDARLKADITPVATYWSKIKAIEVVTFKYNDQSHDDTNVGVIAQQVESVAPEFVDADGFGETPADGVPLKAIYNTDLQFAALRALQEAMARIETLEQRVLALEA